MSHNDKLMPENEATYTQDQYSQPNEYYEALNEEFGDADVSGRYQASFIFIWPFFLIYFSII